MARNYNNHSSYSDYISYFFMPIHLFFFYLHPLFHTMSLTAHKLCMRTILLLVHRLSVSFPLFLPFPENGGSPWGAALLLVFLIVMFSYELALGQKALDWISIFKY
ncbi:hypothetical protein SADUNF_Sadunf01G0007800 [Salix dunnii]|uniref:Uncharacterized protein n=1 Tax=Salix dunnii TaxID=1413687 RepID=A0A835N9B5_9ROSI|nr:hypothetical protein SADUNF_Sadunf01G0007800 [Salix dunnii]